MGSLKILLALFFLLNLLTAFNVDVHIYLAKGLLLKYYSHCERDIEEGAAYAHNILNETENDHCYTTTRCPAFDANYCPTLLTCPAVQVQEQWLGVAKGKEDCEQARYVAIATHYFIEPRDPMKQMINVDQECILNFEAKISQAIAKDPKNFEISQQCNSPNRAFTYTSTNLKDLSIDLDTGVITSNFPLKSHPPNQTTINNSNTTPNLTGHQPRIAKLSDQVTLKSGTKGSVSLSITNIGLDDGRFNVQVACPSGIQTAYEQTVTLNSGETKTIQISLKGDSLTNGVCKVTVSDEKSPTFKDSKTFSFSIVKNCADQCTGFSVRSSDQNSCSCICDTARLAEQCKADKSTANTTSCTCEPTLEPVQPTKCLGIFLILFGLFAGMTATKKL